MVQAEFFFSGLVMFSMSHFRQTQNKVKLVHRLSNPLDPAPFFITINLKRLKLFIFYCILYIKFVLKQKIWGKFSHMAMDIAEQKNLILTQ